MLNVCFIADSSLSRDIPQDTTTLSLLLESTATVEKLLFNAIQAVNFRYHLELPKNTDDYIVYAISTLTQEESNCSLDLSIVKILEEFDAHAKFKVCKITRPRGESMCLLNLYL